MIEAVNDTSWDWPQIWKASPEYRAILEELDRLQNAGEVSCASVD
jgi:hypothetical protein